MATLALAVAAVALGGHANSASAARAAWCGGGEEVAADRQPDAVSGHQIHVIYALPNDRPDRFAEVALEIADDLAAVDRWWRAQDATRTLRFDLFAFAGCPSGFEMLDLSAVRLPHEAAYYDLAQGKQHRRLAIDLELVDESEFKKYLVYYDGAATQLPTACGYSPTLANVGGLSAASIVLLQQGEGCGVLGAGGYTAATAAHELIHNLGAVPLDGPPHACPSDETHICDSDRDLLRASGAFPDLASYVLDVGRDDYYGHSGGWWDVQDSSWLLRLDAPQYPLTVTFGGSAAGTITADLPGLSCTASCTTSWQAGSTVLLDAEVRTSDAGFVGWGGDCSGGDLCHIVMDGPKNVVARFERKAPIHVVIVSRGGRGSVFSSTNVLCAVAACSVSTTKDALLEFVATPEAGSRFVGWTGACTGKGRCSVLADAATTVGAVFGPVRTRLVVRIGGKGTVTSAPAGIRCPTRCAGSFRFDTRVRLRARPANGWRFGRWRGACTGSGRCLVAADAARTVTALFVRPV